MSIRMWNLKTVYGSLLLLLVPAFVAASPTSSPGNPRYLTLIVSCDGFRWDYMELAKSRNRSTPNLDWLARNGVRAEYLRSSFVTHTWPNHWTLVTGQHVETHGVVANTFWDPVYQDVYDSPNTPDPKWYNGTESGAGEPVWVTYELAGAGQYRAGAAVWPASTVPVRGRVPTYSLPQDNALPLRDRVDAIVHWFTLEKHPAGLGLLYLGEPDATAHDHGPDSPQTADMVQEVDSVIGYLLDRLRDTHLLPRVNLVVTGDHGVTRVIDTFHLDDYVDPDWYIVSGESPNLMFMPTPGHESSLVAGLSRVPHSRLVRKEDIPAHLHYTHNRRILPYVLMMDYGFMVCCANGTQPRTAVGEHGWDPAHKDMNAFFLAHGPGFKSGYTSGPVNNTHVYALLCHLLGVTPHPGHQGSLAAVTHLLAHEGRPFSYQHAAGGGRTTLARFSVSTVTLVAAFGVGFVVVVAYVLVKSPARASSGAGRLVVGVPVHHPGYYSTTAARGGVDNTQWLLSGSEDDEDEDLAPGDGGPAGRPSGAMCRAVHAQTPL